MLTTIKSFKNDTFDKLVAETNPIKKRIMTNSGNFQSSYFAYEFYEDDEKWAIVHAEYRVYMRGDVSYVKRNAHSGLTFTRKTKKVKKWFGKGVNFLQPEIVKFLKERNIADIEWLQDIHPNHCHVFIKTATVLSKIFSGKITNVRDLVKHHIKYSLNMKNVSPELFYQYLKVEGSKYETLGNVMYYMKMMAEPNEYLQKLIDNDGRSFFTNQDYDLIHQANILGRKIKVNWSERKKHELHQEWTKEIMALEMDLVEDTDIDYKGELSVHPHGFKLISNQKEIFAVGKTEHHCIYTNYWNRIKDKQYFVLYGQVSGENYTVGITNYGSGFIIDQIQKKYNGGCPDDIRKVMENWIEQYDVQHFFKNNSNIKIDEQVSIW